ncbi:tripartite tricarboxylate transporter permease [Lysinibacillus sp. SGAir0095]|uniref:tripartite tricarboxylate transporter permease n=1 Tax=Lysinibacillus sp. SGAir0095 TaxID=2070463 RepID=UPI0010CCECC3|nr:tripartite tricarboxylate transporter permease [Lysinibacillus sp. SGAir0095]QCR32324.1 Tat pathway signal protein [Lysinibacillus sp. SGAir0095]
MIQSLLEGFGNVLSISTILLILGGTILGLIFGSIPGLTATMAVAICLPITYGMNPIAGMSLLMGLYIGGVSGGLIPAILLKLPGTPSSIATTFDGYPLAQKGEAGKAFSFAIIASFLGGLVSILLLIMVAPPLGQVALKFGPYEYFAIVIFSLTLIASLSGDSLPKGILSGLLGIGFAMVGSAPIDAFPRFTFGISAFDAGFDLMPVLIGLFAISEILLVAEKRGYQALKVNIKKINYKVPLKEYLEEKWNFVRSAAIGIGIGILPGIGGGTANLIAYAAAKNSAKKPEEYGKGTPGGVVASETSNNAAIGGALIPLMSLGIPGDTVTAMLLGGLVLHGLQPGPLLIQNNAPVVYGIFAALLIANVFMAILLFAGMRGFVRLLSIPQYILLPIIMTLCVVGAYGVNNRMFDVYALLFFGLIGYLMLKVRIPLTPLVLGFILGPLLETNLRRGLMLSQGDFMPFVTQPIAALFLLVTVVSVGWKIYKSFKAKQKMKESNEKVAYDN